MRKLVTVVGVTSVCLLLNACATSLDPASAAQIKTLSISAVEEPQYFAYSYFVARQDTVGPSGPDDFNKLMERENLHLGSELRTAIAKTLRSNGYDVTMDDSGTADAVLALKVGAFLPSQQGPAYASHGAEFEPELMLRATLTDAKSNKTLFSRFYLFDNPSIKPMDGTVLFVPDRQYYFQSVDQIFSNPTKAAEGFRSVIPMVAQDIGTAFKKQP
jgi:hypothetical protein